nr:twin-arginine translocase subunit TatC [Haloferax mediterranei]
MPSTRTPNRQLHPAGRLQEPCFERRKKDLQKVFIVFLIGFLGTFYALSLYVWEFFKGVTKAKMDASTEGALEIIAQTPFDVLLLQAKIALVVGIIFAIPPFIYFSRDALKARNAWPKSPVAPWKLALIGLTMLLLFAGGVAYGYLVFFPFTFEFLARSAHNAGFDPKYSIVKWSQFIFLLTVSFGLASQLPLAVTGLSYTEIVPYELFRDKWRHAVVGIFAVGALFTPPDPFTQIMWAVPVISLYAFSLYLARVVVTAKRGSEKLDLKGTATKHWNLLAGTGVGGGLLVYAFYEYEGIKLANDALVAVGSQYRFLEPGSQLVLSAFIVAGVLVALLLGLAYLVFRDIQQIERTRGRRRSTQRNSTSRRSTRTESAPRRPRRSPTARKTKSWASLRPPSTTVTGKRRRRSSTGSTTPRRSGKPPKRKPKNRTDSKTGRPALAARSSTNSPKARPTKTTSVVTTRTSRSSSIRLPPEHSGSSAGSCSSLRRPSAGSTAAVSNSSTTTSLIASRTQ